MLIKTQNYFINFLSKILFKTPKKSKKIAIYRFGSFGDSIVAFPAIKTIREFYPNAIIDIYNKPESDNLIKMKDLLDENMYDNLITLKANISIKEFYNLIKDKNYDLWFELSATGITFKQAFQKLIFLKISGIKFVNGIEITPHKFLAKYYKNNYNFISERERLLNNLKKLNLNIEKNRLSFPLKNFDNNFNKVNQILQDKNIDRNRLIVMITKSKRESTTWQIEKWINLSKELIKKGYFLAFIGAPSDNEFIQKIIKELDDKYSYSFAGEFSVLDSTALLKLSKLAVSVDTGPMHLAYAVGTNVISLFSARDYVNRWYPPKELGIVFRKDVKCSPCFLETCPNNNECMNKINEKEILNEIVRKL